MSASIRLHPGTVYEVVAFSFIRRITVKVHFPARVVRFATGRGVQQYMAICDERWVVKNELDVVLSSFRELIVKPNLVGWRTGVVLFKNRVVWRTVF